MSYEVEYLLFSRKYPNCQRHQRVTPQEDKKLKEELSRRLQSLYGGRILAISEYRRYLRCRFEDDGARLGGGTLVLKLVEEADVFLEKSRRNENYGRIEHCGYLWQDSRYLQSDYFITKKSESKLERLDLIALYEAVQQLATRQVINKSYSQTLYSVIWLLYLKKDLRKRCDPFLLDFYSEEIASRAKWDLFEQCEKDCPYFFRTDEGRKSFLVCEVPDRSPIKGLDCDGNEVSLDCENVLSTPQGEPIIDYEFDYDYLIAKCATSDDKEQRMFAKRLRQQLNKRKQKWEKEKIRLEKLIGNL